MSTPLANGTHVKFTGFDPEEEGYQEHYTPQIGEVGVIKDLGWWSPVELGMMPGEIPEGSKIIYVVSFPDADKSQYQEDFLFESELLETEIEEVK